MLTLDSLLQSKENKGRMWMMRTRSFREVVAWRQRVIDHRWTQVARRGRAGTHSDVTLPLLHMTPSHPPSQGSLAEDQLDGAFVHLLFSELSAEAAEQGFQKQGASL